MASHVGPSRASSISYDEPKVKKLIAASREKATQTAINVLAQLNHIKTPKECIKGMDANELAQQIEYAQSTRTAQARKKRLQSDIKLQLIFDKLTVATMAQMNLPIRECTKTPLEILVQFMLRSNNGGAQFLNLTILPAAIDLLDVLKKDQPAILEELECDDLWEISSNKPACTSKDDKKI